MPPLRERRPEGHGVLHAPRCSWRSRRSISSYKFEQVTPFELILAAASRRAGKGRPLQARRRGFHDVGCEPRKRFELLRHLIGRRHRGARSDSAMRFCLVAEGGAVIANPGISPAPNPARDWPPTPCNSAAAAVQSMRIFLLLAHFTIDLGRFNRLVGLNLGHLLCNAALSFQRVIGVLEPQEITFGEAEKLA